MSRKRRNTSSPEGSPSPVRQKPLSLSLYDDSGDSLDEAEKPQVSQEFGQTGAFPGLGSDKRNEPFYGPANDGIDYLRMVRSEARGVPTLLTALRETDTTRTQLDEDNGGYWEDDTYVAAPKAPTVVDPQRPTAQVRYYECLLAQFRLLQATLRCTPPLAAIQALGASHPISFPRNSSKALAQWQHQMQDKDPNMVQMACLDSDSVWELVGLLNITLEVGNSTPQKLGAWLWAALARCPEQGEMLSEEISVLRDLARTAVDILEVTRMEHSRVREEVHDVQSNVLDIDDKPDPSDEAPSVTTEHMVLDMIITIVGEVYGQRDLLDKRIVWQVPTA